MRSRTESSLTGKRRQIVKEAILVFLFVSSTLMQAFAQSEDCETCWTVTDNSCSNTAACRDWTNIESVTFTAPCNGNYNFKCKTVCSNPNNCYVCVTCSRLVKTGDNTVIAECITSLDPFGFCEDQCDDVESVSLTQGLQYRIEVTMLRCSTENCQCIGCTAKARVEYPGSTCTTW